MLIFTAIFYHPFSNYDSILWLHSVIDIPTCALWVHSTLPSYRSTAYFHLMRSLFCKETLYFGLTQTSRLEQPVTPSLVRLCCWWS